MKSSLSRKTTASWVSYCTRHAAAICLVSPRDQAPAHSLAHIQWAAVPLGTMLGTEQASAALGAEAHAHVIKGSFFKNAHKWSCQ